MKWEEKRLGDLVSTLKGYAFKSSKYVNSGIPIVRASDFSNGSISSGEMLFYPFDEGDTYKKYRLDINDILIQTVGSWGNNPNSVVGKVVHVPSKQMGALLNQNIVKLTPVNEYEIDKEYLFYRLRCDDFKKHNIGNAVGAANQASITLETIRAFRMHLPPLVVQKRIASILSSYDDLIENNQRQIKLLEEAAMRLYKEWFVNLRFPGCNYRNELPVGWKRDKSKEYVFLNYGKSLTESERTGKGVPVYGSSGVVGSHEKSMVTGPAIIVGRKGNVGSVYLSFDDFWPIDTVYYVTTSLNMYYCYFELKTRTYLNNDSAVPGLSREAFNMMEIVVPSARAQKDFHDIVESMMLRINALNKLNEKSRQTRDKLLPKLMNGEIEV